ncbi:hypothetical protein V2J09_000944, partial [Rumex salicifolius]
EKQRANSATTTFSGSVLKSHSSEYVIGEVRVRDMVLRRGEKCDNGELRKGYVKLEEEDNEEWKEGALKSWKRGRSVTASRWSSDLTRKKSNEIQT